MTLLALADMDGIVYGTKHGLSRIANINPDDIDEAWDELLRPDPDSSDKMRAPENEGRRLEVVSGGYRLLNYLYYRGLRNDDDRRIQNREAQARHRARLIKGKPVSASVSQAKPVKAQAEAEAEAEAETETETETETDSEASPPKEALGGGTPSEYRTSIAPSAKADGAVVTEPKVDKSSRPKFRPPTIEEILAYAKAEGISGDDSQDFFDWFQACGWRVGSGTGKPMRSWQHALQGWHRRSRARKPRHDWEPPSNRNRQIKTQNGEF